MMSELQISLVESVKDTPCGIKEKQLSARHWRAALYLSQFLSAYEFRLLYIHIQP